MNKLTKIAIAISLFTSLVAKAEEMAAEPAQEQAEAINHFESIPGYEAADEANLDSEAVAAEETILDEAVSSEEAELPQS